MGLKRRGVLVGDDDNRAFLSEQIGDSPADAVRAGADKGELSGKLGVHRDGALT
jgi:hypothetical protein